MDAPAAKPQTGARRQKPQLAAGLVVAGLIAAAGIMLGNRELLLVDTVDNVLGDWRTSLFSPRAPRQRADIAVVLITEETLLDYPARSPVDRALIADLIGAIDAAAPKAIGLDFIFDRRTAHDAKLMAALKSANAPVVLGAIDDRLTLPRQLLEFQKDLLTKAGRPVGHILFERKSGRLIRFDEAVRLVARPPKAMPQRRSFAFTLAKAAGETPKSSSRTIAWLLPPADSSQPLFMTINIPQHRPQERRTALEDVFPASWRDLLRGRIVLVGGNLLGIDQHTTPLSVLKGATMPGVFIHAQALAQHLDGDRDVRVPHAALNALIVFFVAFLCYLAGRRWRLGHYQKFYQILGLVVLGAISVTCFWLLRVTLPSGAIAFAWLLGALAGHYSHYVFGKLGLED